MLLAEWVFWFALATVVYTYVGYPLLLGALHWVLPRRASRAAEGLTPSISIILAAYNEASCIREKLDNCLGLDYPPGSVEILVGSDGSDDGTNEIVEEYVPRGIRLFAYTPRRGKMATVNRLVREARHEICVFSDVSEIFDPDAVRQLVPHFADPQIGAVTGNHVYNRAATGIGAGTSFYWRFQRFLQCVESRLYTVCACDGTIYSCRRELFPFPADETINDDVAVPLGIISQGYRVIFEPRAVIRGNPLAETRRFFRQKVRSQAGKYQNFASYPGMFRPWPLSRWWIFLSHTFLPVMVPWCLVALLVSHVILVVGTSSLIYRILFAGHAGFYLLAAVGWLAEKRHTYLPGLVIPFYFVTANLGSLCGFYAYLSRVQSAKWQKVE